MSEHESPALEERHVDANGIRIRYGEGGRGRPIVLLHGGLLTSDSWVDLMSMLAEDHHVIAPDLRGHGGSGHTGGPITYGLLADDAIALVEALGLERPAFVGLSDGGNAALEVAMRRPELPSAIVAAGAWNWRSAAFEKWVGGFLGVPPRPDLADPAAAVAEANPGFARWCAAMQGDAWPALLNALWPAWTVEPALGARELARIRAPTLYVVAEDDVISVKEAEEMAHHTPGAKLHVEPGAGHGFLMQDPERCLEIVRGFLSALPR